jgi:hypothetical protein
VSRTAFAETTKKKDRAASSGGEGCETNRNRKTSLWMQRRPLHAGCQGRATSGTARKGVVGDGCWCCCCSRRWRKWWWSCRGRAAIGRRTSRYVERAAGRLARCPKPSRSPSGPRWPGRPPKYGGEHVTQRLPTPQSRTPSPVFLIFPFALFLAALSADSSHALLPREGRAMGVYKAI